MSIMHSLGPIMIGPSSSHTAGAARLAKVAADIVQMDFCEVHFGLHGSFAETYKGHGTDRALLAGVMGMLPDDKRLIEAFRIADERGLKYSYTPVDLGEVHPNTVQITFVPCDGSKSKYIIGSSVGGGAIEITNVNGVSVSLTAQRPTILIKYHDMKGVIHTITELLLFEKVNIATMSVTRDESMATMVVELDSNISEETYQHIATLKGVRFIAEVGGVR